MSSLTGVTIRSVLNVIHSQLPFRVWIPCDHNVPLVFWIITIQQIAAVIFATIINVGTETIVFGLFLQTCAQLEIFENRLHKLITNKTTKYLGHSLALSNEKKVIISEYIHHHLSIYKLVTERLCLLRTYSFIRAFWHYIFLNICVFLC